MYLYLISTQSNDYTEYTTDSSFTTRLKTFLSQGTFTGYLDWIDSYNDEYLNSPGGVFINMENVANDDNGGSTLPWASDGVTSGYAFIITIPISNNTPGQHVQIAIPYSTNLLPKFRMYINAQFYAWRYFYTT